MTISSQSTLIPLDALVPDRPMRVEDGEGRPICLVLSEGTLRAYIDECPHRGHPLSEGSCIDGGRLRCALHGWEFSVDDGTALAPASPFRLAPADVRVVDGYVEINS